MDSLRIVFAGTPDFAASVLNKILVSNHEVIAVYTQPDRPAGRGRKLTASPVKALAIEHDIDVHQPANFKQPEDITNLKALNADIMVVVAYGLLLPEAVLETPRLGCINVHASLLPRWRGAAPIQRAIAAGDKTTGVTIMKMDKGLDTGAMLRKVETPIDDTDTGGSLHDRLAILGAQACVDSLNHIHDDLKNAEEQDDELACYAHKLTKDEANLNWNDDALNLYNQVRAFNPWPVAQTQLAHQKIRVWEASHTNSGSSTKPGTVIKADKKGIEVACGKGTLIITRLQLPGGRALSSRDILNARHELFAPGTQLGSTT